MGGNVDAYPNLVQVLNLVGELPAVKKWHAERVERLSGKKEE